MVRERFTVHKSYGGSIFTIHDDQVAYLVIAECETRSDAVMLASYLNEANPMICGVDYAGSKVADQIKRWSR